MLCSQKYNLKWVLQQLREVYTKNFKTSPAEEDDVEMTGDREDSGDPSRDEDDFEKQMRLSYESQARASTVRRYGKPQALDQLEWMKEKPLIGGRGRRSWL